MKDFTSIGHEHLIKHNLSVRRDVKICLKCAGIKANIATIKHIMYSQLPVQSVSITTKVVSSNPDLLVARCIRYNIM